jgi:lipopolysaccharide biosynthesis protein
MNGPSDSSFDFVCRPSSKIGENAVEFAGRLFEADKITCLVCKALSYSDLFEDNARQALAEAVRHSDFFNLALLPTLTAD